MKKKVVNKQISIDQIIRVADYLKEYKKIMMKNMKQKKRKTKIYRTVRKIMNMNL